MIKSDEIRIMFVGDISLGDYYTSFGHGPRSYAEFRSPFSELMSTLNESDFVVGNLEAPLTNNNLDLDDPESMVLRGKPEYASLLSNANFKFLQVANNHTVQHGKAGFIETLHTLER